MIWRLWWNLRALMAARRALIRAQRWEDAHGGGKVSGTITWPSGRQTHLDGDPL